MKTSNRGYELMKLTLKRNNKRYPTVKGYEKAVSEFPNFGITVVERAFEFDSNKKLHLHALIETQSNYYCKKFINYFVKKGYHVCLERFKKRDQYDVDGWLQYIRKDKDIIHLQLQSYFDNVVMPHKRDIAQECLDFKHKFPIKNPEYQNFVAEYKDQIKADLSDLLF